MSAALWRDCLQARPTHNPGCLLERHPDEVTQLDQLGFAHVRYREFHQCIVHGQQRVFASGSIQFVRVGTRFTRTALGSPTTTGAIDEGAAHRLGGGKQVLPPIPVML
jgi:hypothetical protein